MRTVKKLVTGILCLGAVFPFYAAEKKSVYTDADVVWQDDFNGDKLNMKDWNIEYHEPGWVNNELQKYGDQPENVYVKNGNLVIQAVKKTDAAGNVSYSSARINTQDKHDFLYGRFEARIKVPEGKGFLPAFWMMPTVENLYGQWPKCGEIDIMEVLGDAVKTTYGTLHFGEPHTQRQGTFTVAADDLSKDFHVYACEWDPGEIRFYLDGTMFYKTSDWFTKRKGFGETTYPAPFDQKFYMILNLAVGGNWPGNPDASAKFAENARLVVDYVKVYQKKTYDANVSKPVADAPVRSAGAGGNFVLNPGFTVQENLSDGKGWDFLTAGKGRASAEISGGALNVTTENCGELDYSVQVVQPDIPLVKGCSYRFSFDAWADDNRTIIPAITAPNVGWIRYFPDTKMPVTTQKKSYSFDFDMKSGDDPAARVEFNLGNQGSNAGVHLTNVSVVMTRAAAAGQDARSILPDGNLIYNGEFQEGQNRLASWTVNNTCAGADVAVTNKNTVRELKVTVPAGVKSVSDVSLSQEGLPFAGGKTYLLSFDAHTDAPKTIEVVLPGQTVKIPLSAGARTYKSTFTVPNDAGKRECTFHLGTPGTTYIDNVRVQEDALLINGDFSGGMTAFEVYAHDSASVDYAVDTLSENGALCMNIAKTGSQDWMIQLKQNNITLEKGKWYVLSFEAKSTLPRTIMYALQRDGSRDNNWMPYSGTVKIDVGTAFKTYSTKFQMTEATDPATILSISMGAVDGKSISTKHTVTIDTISLVQTEGN
jgi:Beta-glucanase/Beta-glucan synthetase